MVSNTFRMELKQAISYLSLAFLLAACSNSESPSNNGNHSGVIMPLAIGNSWTYQVEPADSANGVPTFTDSITGFDTINGIAWFVVQRSSSGSPFYYREASDGLHEALPFDTNGTFDNLCAKYPAQSGDHYTDSMWVSYHLAGDTTWKVMPGSSTTTVDSADEVISVPAGTFHALKYEYFPHLNLLEQYFAPGVGMVQMGNLGGTVRYVLVHYSLH